MSKHNAQAAAAAACCPTSLTANPPVVVPGESQQHFEELVHALITHFKPANPAERAQLDKMAAAPGAKTAPGPSCAKPSTPAPRPTQSPAL